MIPSTVSDGPNPPAPSGMRLLGRIAGHAWQQVRVEGPADGLRVLLGAGRMLGERERLTELFAIPAYARLMAAQPRPDAFFFISHRHFLSRGFGTEERIACVLDHFRFEQARFAPRLLRVLHGDGLPLWRQAPGHEIRLRANADTRHEGPLSLVLRNGAETLHQLSFAWVDAARLGPGAGHGPVLFATRSQSQPPDSAGLAGFRSQFPQNSPAYFGLAALSGLASALGQARIVGVRDVCQIAYDACHAAGFKRSYDDFWLGFGARPLGGHGFEMPVPAAVVPLEQLKARHRARARQRREHWRQVSEAALAAVSPYLKV